MLKRLLHGFFGAGRLPGDIRPLLEAEGLDFLEEGVWGSTSKSAEREELFPNSLFHLSLMRAYS